MNITPANTQPRPETFPQQTPVGRLKNSPHLLKRALQIAYKMGNEYDRAKLHSALNDHRLPHQFQHQQIAQRILQLFDNEDLKNLALACTSLRSLAERNRSTIWCGGEDLDASIRNSPKAVNVFIEGASTPQQLEALQRLSNIQILTLVDGHTTLDALGAPNSPVNQLPTTLTGLIITGSHNATQLPTSILDGLPHLNSLSLEGLPNLRHLPDRKPGQLEHLIVSNCPQLTALPDWCADLLSLDVRGCTSLERLPDAIREQQIVLKLRQNGHEELSSARESTLLDIRVDSRLEPGMLDFIDYVFNLIAQGPVLQPLPDAP